jgi:hypothetical protein
MNPIFDNSGKVVAWLGGAEVIYDLNGTPHAYIKNENVFDYSGFYHGRFQRGFFRDKNGNAVAFIKGAQGGPLIPLPQLPPLPPLGQLTPLPAIDS